ncbi:TPA: hypothetical protein HA265_00960, partial [Candidatus Woesearchaeota archaeon]|nr:hypothetical protein [Candidatus Woesearchaeota archaeon]
MGQKRLIIPAIVALFILFLASAVAAESKLEISELTVKVDGDRQSADESGGTIKVPPASKL